MNVPGRIALVFAGVLGTGLLAARPVVRGEALEVARIRSHFDSVLVELRARDVSALPAAARANRASLVAELDRYRNAGAFPHNYDFPGQAIPYFVDRGTGVRCAVANLLEKSGRGDIVERVRRTNNNVWVADLRGDTAFANWLDGNGLTLAEAARIQVPYVQPVSKAEVARDVGFGVAALTAVVGSTVTSLVNMTVNQQGDHTRMAKGGVIFGVASAVLGARMLAERDLQSAGRGVMLLGGVSTGLGALSIHQHSLVTARADSSRARAVAEARIEPTVDARGAAGARVGLSIGF